MANQSLRYQFKTSNIIIKLVVINGVIFLGTYLTATLMQVDLGTLLSWFVLPSEPGNFILQPWSIITYSFLHADLWHVLFNMLYLYWFGRFILNLFSEKRFLTIYLLGAICGGFLYLFGYNFLPLFADKPSAILLGASGAVMAIIVFVAAYSPQAQMRIFMFSIKVWHIALVLIVLDILRLSSNENAGGMMAHLGGAAFGFVYARQLLKGNDIGLWFEKIMDSFANLFKSRKEKPFKKVHRNKTTQGKSSRSKPKENKSDHQKKVDAILDKISKSGYESLTKAEKDYLFKAGKDD